MKREHYVFGGLVTLALYVLLTGGLVVSSIGDFGYQRPIRLAGGLKSDIWMSPKLSSFDVLLLFHYYSWGAPFSLRIQIWDDSKQYREIEITQVLLEYRDGEVVQKTVGWSRQLVPYTQYNSSRSGIVQTEMFMLSDQIEDLVLRHADVKITLKGKLVKADGDTVTFETSESFKAESRSPIGTYWEFLADVQ